MLEIKPLKITTYKKEDHNEKRTILLMPTKDGQNWQYVNLTKGYICPCLFPTRVGALNDFVVNYSHKFYKVEFEELDV